MPSSFQTLPVRAWYCKLFIAVLYIVFLGIIFGACFLFFASVLKEDAKILQPLWYVMALMLFISIFSIFYQYYAYKRFSFRLSPQMLTIKQGVWWKQEIYLSREKVQYVDVIQTPMGSRFGLANVLVFTAGSMMPMIRISGLNWADAQAVRAQLVGEDDES